MTRPNNWPAMLNAYLNASANLEFQWGKADCAIWVNEWARHMRGLDYADQFPPYHDAESAKAALKSKGFASHTAMVNFFLAQKPVKKAQRGDIVQQKRGGALGICNGLYSVFLTERGLVAQKTEDCFKAWEL